MCFVQDNREEKKKNSVCDADWTLFRNPSGRSQMIQILPLQCLYVQCSNLGALPSTSKKKTKKSWFLRAKTERIAMTYLRLTAIKTN